MWFILGAIGIGFIGYLIITIGLAVIFMWDEVKMNIERRYEPE